jgi:hypothetical protein
MSFAYITEGSKDYIKYILQLSEDSMTGITYRAPGGVASRGKKQNKKKESFAFSGGAGGEGLGGGDNIKPGQFVSKEKDKDGKLKDAGLRAKIMLGATQIPRTEGSLETQASLDYMTSLGQAQSSLEFADQMMPAAVKLLLAKGLYDTKIKAKPGSNISLSAAFNAGLSGASEAEKAAVSPFETVAKDTLNQIEKMTGVEGLGGKNNPLAQKVMQYTKNLGAIDPFNPLLGLKLGVEMLGGKEVLRRTRELGGVQSAGAASSMGHPSGFRGY